MTETKAAYRGPGGFTRPEDKWRDQAACRGMDVNHFFPVSDKTGPHPDAAAACAACPVRVRCLDYAIASRSDGYWGGLTEKERAADHRNERRRELAAERRAEGESAA